MPFFQGFLSHFCRFSKFSWGSRVTPCATVSAPCGHQPPRVSHLLNLQNISEKYTKLSLTEVRMVKKSLKYLKNKLQITQILTILQLQTASRSPGSGV